MLSNNLQNNILILAVGLYTDAKKDKNIIMLTIKDF